MLTEFVKCSAVESHVEIPQELHLAPQEVLVQDLPAVPMVGSTRPGHTHGALAAINIHLAEQSTLLGQRRVVAVPRLPIKMVKAGPNPPDQEEIID